VAGAGGGLIGFRILAVISCERLFRKTRSRNQAVKTHAGCVKREISMIRKAMIAAAALGASLAVSAPAFAADVTGLWATPSNGGQVEISRCGNSLCGKLVTSNHIKENPGLKDIKNKDASQRSRPLKNLQMLYDFGGGPAKWTGGKVYNPEDGGTYAGTIELVSNTELKLKGCIVAPMCKTQKWTRIR
jgi:uncharacterized protein (DUF2147 family)